MDLLRHNAIANILEQGKLGGWLSDYLVAWHGPSGQLAPNVTVWGAAGRTEAEIRAYLSGLLTGFVTDHEIVVSDS